MRNEPASRSLLDGVYAAGGDPLAPFAAMSPSQAVPAAALLAILVGVVVIAGGLARLGFLTDPVSYTHLTLPTIYHV